MVKKIILSVFVLVVLASCWYLYRYYQAKKIVKNTDAVTKQFASQLKHDAFPVVGTYHWTFYLGPVKQISTHIFASTAIDYRMRGKVHSTDYQMQLLSYDDAEKKWIGQTPDGIVFVLFFKDVDDTSITIYKHKCSNGLPEAIAMTRPSDDETADHGWNTYTLEGVEETSDVLPFAGRYMDSNNANITLEIDDSNAQWNGKMYQKLTHHLGERRWVGQQNDTYLVVFYEQLPDNSLYLSLQTYNDVEEAYEIKHGQQTFDTYIKATGAQQ